MQNPHENAYLSFACSYNQSVIQKFRMCLNFPTSLLLVPQEIDMMMQGTLLPLTSQQIARVVRSIMEEVLGLSNVELPPIQIERARSFIESALHELNVQSLSER